MSCRSVICHQLRWTIVIFALFKFDRPAFGVHVPCAWTGVSNVSIDPTGTTLDRWPLQVPVDVTPQITFKQLRSVLTDQFMQVVVFVLSTYHKVSSKLTHYSGVCRGDGYAV